MENVISEIKDRINILRSCLPSDGPVDRLDYHFLNEIQFLENLLDIANRG